MVIEDFIKQFGYPRVSVFKAKKEGRLDEALVRLPDKKMPVLDLGKAVAIMEGNGDYAKHRTRKMKEEADKLAWERELREGRWIDNELHVRHNAETARQFAQACEVLPDRLAPMLAGKSELEVRREMIKELDAMRHRVAAAMTEVTDKVVQR